MKILTTHLRVWALLALFWFQAISAAVSPGTAFTYQGRLTDSGAAATGFYDLRFTLHDSGNLGSPVGGLITVAPLEVTDGLFTTMLDFGAGAFTGADRWLEISVRTNGSAAAYTTLTPRQKITTAPYALFARGVNAAGITGAIPNASLSGAYGNPLTLSNAGNNIAGTFTGNGNGLNNLNAGSLVGALADARLSANVALLNGSPGFTSSIVAGHGLRLNNSNVWFRSNLDFNHGLGYYGSGKPYGVSVPDGPALFGFGGGVLGSQSGGAHSVLTWTSNSVGIGTDTPRAQLEVAGSAIVRNQLHVDYNDLNNSTLASGLVFGGPTSGEGIGSKRTGAGNQFGLDFYTVNTPRMTIANDGRVGIGLGTSQPRTLVDIRGVDPILELRNINDGGRGGFLVNTFASVQLGLFAEGNGQGQVQASGRRAFFGFNTDGKVGSLTNSLGSPNPPAFRNLLDDGAGNAAIAGNLAAKNLPGVEFDVPADPAIIGELFIVDGGNTATIKTITVEAHAGGFLVLLGSVFGGVQSGNVSPAQGRLELFDETANTTFGMARFNSAQTSTQIIHGVLPVPAGTRRLSLKFKVSNESGDRGYYYSNTGSFIAMYFPTQL